MTFADVILSPQVGWILLVLVIVVVIDDWRKGSIRD